MNLKKTNIDNLFLLASPVHEDNRGFFRKTYHEEIMLDLGLSTSWKEEYYTTSKKNVIRGMHFQLPPNDHEKIVYCVKGSVKDVVLDLRVNSRTYGQAESFDLSENDGMALYIPKGFAHGFLSKEDDSILSYKVTSVYNPTSDSGILWNSFGFDWEIETPILSDRDCNHSLFTDFKSDFL